MSVISYGLSTLIILNNWLIYRCYNQKSKVVPELHGPMGSADFHQTPPYTSREHGYGVSESRCMPVYSPASAGILIAPTHRGMARLSWPRWLITYLDVLSTCTLQTITHPCTNRTQYKTTWLDQRVITKPNRHPAIIIILYYNNFY